MNFVSGLVTFVVLVVLHTLDTGASIELSSKQLIRLHKSVELYCQVGVLCLKNLSMSFKSIFLIQTVLLLPGVLMIDSSLALYISPRHEQLFLKTFQVDLKVSYFMLQIIVVSLSRPQIPIQVVIFTRNFISVTFECIDLLIDFMVAITGPNHFPLSVFETVGFHMKVMSFLLD